MGTLSETKKIPDYHIRAFDPKARRIAKAGASVDNIDIGAWIARAVMEKFARDFVRRAREDQE